MIVVGKPFSLLNFSGLLHPRQLDTYVTQNEVFRLIHRCRTIRRRLIRLLPQFNSL